MEIWKEVDQYVLNCHNCQRSRSSRHSMFSVLWQLSVPEKPLEDIAMDFVVELLQCKGFDVIWVVVDGLSMIQHFVPCHTMIDASGLAEWFLREMVDLTGLPATIISDQESLFATVFCRQLCNCLRIQRRMSTAFHPLIDGQTERMNDS